MKSPAASGGGVSPHAEPPGASAADPDPAIESWLRKLWAAVLGREDIPLDQGFFELGGQSLHVLELMARVETHFGKRFPLNLVVEAPTVREMAEAIEAELLEENLEARGGAGEDPSCLVSIRPTGARLPLFLCPPAGGGILCYYMLSHLLGPTQPFFALHETSVVPAGAQLGIEEMAGRYIRALRTVQSEGPYQVGGWSFGGFLAFEIARQLTEAGCRVERLLIIDSDIEILSRGRRLRDIGSGLMTAMQMFYYSKPFVRNMLHVRLVRAMRDSGTTKRDSGPLRRLLRRLIWGMGVENAGVANAIAENPNLAELSADPGFQPMRRMRPYIRALRRYVPGVWRGDIDLFAIAPRKRGGSSENAAVSGWEAVTSGKVTVHRIPGNHFTLFQPPHLSSLAECIGERLLKREA